MIDLKNMPGKGPIFSIVLEYLKNAEAEAGTIVHDHAFSEGFTMMILYPITKIFFQYDSSICSIPGWRA